METLTQPTLLLKPFAESGDKNTIPVTNTDASNPQLADLTNGFPQITSETPANNGLPPERKDFNGLGYLTTTYDYFAQAGGTYTFNQTVSDAIGGYPEGSRLWYTPSSGETMIVRSLIQNNTYNFNTDPSYIDGVKWKVDTPTLDGNNIWTGTNTFSEDVTFSNNVTFSDDVSLGSNATATTQAITDNSTKILNAQWFRKAICTLSVAHLTAYETIATNISSYIAPIDGFIDVVIGATYQWNVYINAVEIQKQVRWSGDSTTTTHVFIPVLKGDVLTWYINDGAFYGGTMYRNY